MVLVVKNLPANAGDLRDVGSIPGWIRSLGRGHGNPLQYSCLENPMDRGAWRATVPRVAKSRARLKRLQFSSVAQSCLTLCDPMNRAACQASLSITNSRSLPKIMSIESVMPSHPLSSPSPALNLSQHQGLFQWVSSSHQVAEVLEFHLQH